MACGQQQGCPVDVRGIIQPGAGASLGILRNAGANTAERAVETSGTELSGTVAASTTVASRGVGRGNYNVITEEQTLDQLLQALRYADEVEPGLVTQIAFRAGGRIFMVTSVANKDYRLSGYRQRRVQNWLIPAIACVILAIASIVAVLVVRNNIRLQSLRAAAGTAAVRKVFSFVSHELR
jgi:hypothetical protein